MMGTNQWRRGLQKQRRRGFTLIEATVAVSFLAVASLIAFPTMVSYYDLSKSSRAENLATFALESAIEDLRAVPFDDITTQYPDGGTMPKFTMFVVAEEGEGTHVWDALYGEWINVGYGNGTHRVNAGASLEDQVAIVRYADPAEDPLVVTVSLRWRDEKGRFMSGSLTSAITK